MTLEDSREAVKTLLRAHNQQLCDDSVLDGWLAQGQIDTAALTYCYQQVAVFAEDDSPAALIVGQRVYTQTGAVGGGGLGLDDHLRTLHVTWDSVPLLRWTPQMTGVAEASSGSSGQPRYYQEFAGDLILVPYPDAAALSSYTLEVTYAALPDTWTSGAGVLPVGPDTAPVWFAACRVAMMRRAWSQAQQWYQRYMQLVQRVRLQQLLQAAQRRGEQEQPVRSERQDEVRVLQLRAQARQQRTQRAR